MNQDNKNNLCPLCQSSSKKSKLHLINSRNAEAYFCWNCTAVWPKRKRSFIDQLKYEGNNYTWGDAYFDNNEGREELIKWKITSTGNLRMLV